MDKANSRQDCFENHLGFRLKKIHDIMEKSGNRGFKNSGLTATQVHVLGCLRRNRNQEITQRDIEKYMQVSHPTIVGVLKRLEENGFITTRMISREGKQQKLVYQTTKADELHDKIVKQHAENEAMMTKGFTQEELTLFKSYLDRVFNNIKEEEYDQDIDETNKTV